MIRVHDELWKTFQNLLPGLCQGRLDTALVNNLDPVMVDNEPIDKISVVMIPILNSCEDQRIRTRKSIPEWTEIAGVASMIHMAKGCIPDKINLWQEA
jgi:hypothetical protein